MNALLKDYIHNPVYEEKKTYPWEGGDPPCTGSLAPPSAAPAGGLPLRRHRSKEGTPQVRKITTFIIIITTTMITYIYIYICIYIYI